MKKIIPAILLVCFLLFTFSCNQYEYYPNICIDELSPNTEIGVFRYEREGWRSSGLIMKKSEAKKYTFADDNFLKHGPTSRYISDTSVMSEKNKIGVLYQGEKIVSTESIDIGIIFTSFYFFDIYGSYDPLVHSDFVDYDAAKLELEINGTQFAIAEDEYAQNKPRNAEYQMKSIRQATATGGGQVFIIKLYRNTSMYTPTHTITYYDEPTNVNTVSIPLSWFDFSASEKVDATISLNFYKDGKIVAQPSVPCTFSLIKTPDGIQFQGSDADVSGYVFGAFDCTKYEFIGLDPKRGCQG